MSITVTKDNENEYKVFSLGVPIGKIEAYTSPFYAENLYLRLDLTQYDPSLGTELFSVLKSLAGRPLQVMAESENTVLTNFLKAGGFKLKRRCFESEVSDFAFLEGNEIAYLGSADIGSFRDFAVNLVLSLFEAHRTLVFESDDCDPLAMGLRSLFKNQRDSSFDTYIFT